MLKQLKQELEKLKDSERAKHDQRFFKTGPGEYGEGRISFGIKTEDKRKLAREYQKLKLNDIQKLLDSKIADHQFIALVILKYKFEKAKNKDQIIDFYLNNTKNINNWDLVDISAYHILGNYLLDKNKDILYQLAKSNDLWEKRIAIISTFAFIKNNNFKDTLNIAEILLNDKHDLIHKAAGWMLRELGKRNQDLEEEFLKKHHKKMPRTMLRYAIERFDENKKKFYMKK